jgi:hypothetical protein
LVDYEDTGAGELLLKAVSRGQDAAAATLDSFNPGMYFAKQALQHCAKRSYVAAACLQYN